MKKLTSVILILLILSAFPVCIQAENDIILPSDVEKNLLYLGTWDEYNTFIENTALSDIFVPYEEIKQFGNFNSLVILSDYYLDNYSSYMYGLLDDSNFQFALYIEDSTVADPPISTKHVTNIDPNDMRILLEEERGYYQYGCLKYKYISGKLYSISWNSNGNKYTLSGSFDKYPYTNSTIIGKLLDLSTATSTIYSIFGDDTNDTTPDTTPIPTAPVEPKDEGISPWVWVAVISGSVAVVGAAVLAAVLIPRRKKRKNSTA